MDPIQHAFSQFVTEGTFVRAQPLTHGHINKTYVVECDGGTTVHRYVLQKVNNFVFKDVPLLMNNVQHVCSYLLEKIGSGVQTGLQRSLCLIPTSSGKLFLHNGDGSFWRLYPYIENTVTHDVVSDTSVAKEIAKGFGHFQVLLEGIDVSLLQETIPDFHNTCKRFKRFEEVVQADTCGRASSVQKEIDFVLERRTYVERLRSLMENNSLPVRVTHNDTKMNNVLLDKQTGKASCVVDLDTVMPGYLMNDFGDFVRSATGVKGEESDTPEKNVFDIGIFEALAEGFLSVVSPMLTPAERDHLVFGCLLMTYESVVRFLTDYLEGDVYFCTTFPEHNLRRCRSQIALLASMEESVEPMEAFVRGFGA